MSETLTESTLLSEVVALRESNQALNKRLEAIESEKREIEKREQVNVLLRDGRITPAESDVVSKAYELREIQPEFLANVLASDQSTARYRLRQSDTAQAAQRLRRALYTKK